LVRGNGYLLKERKFIPDVKLEETMTTQA